jgi:hypothetical protein
MIGSNCANAELWSLRQLPIVMSSEVSRDCGIAIVFSARRDPQQ